MKKTIGLLVLALLLALCGMSCIRYVPFGESGRPSGPYDGAYDNRYDRIDDLDSAYFYDQLQPHGLWVSYRPYGYVWIPGNVGYNWRPYSRGRWAWTDYGWTWISFERWGWICFHYGRWGWDQRLGWYWVPDILWGPAWVAWRWGDAHIGWAPLPPGADFIPGRGFGRNRWDIPGHFWCFVRGHDFLDRRIDRWVLPSERNMTIVNLTRLEVKINERDRRIVNDGLDPDFVQRQVNRPVERLTLKDATRPGPEREEGDALVISRPAIRRNETAKPKQVLDQDRAEREINSEASGRIHRRATQNEEEVLRKDHDQERWLMKESQETELNAVRRKAEQERVQVQNPVDKKKVAEQAENQVSELKKKHEQEKAELEKRQKAEESKTKRTPVRRKVEKKDDKS